MGNPPFANGPDFASFGMIPFTQPPADPNNNLGIGAGFTGHSNYANIWQMTNMPQPPLENPNLPWFDPDYLATGASGIINRYTPGTVDQQRSAAQAFATIWNTCSTSGNNISFLTGPLPLPPPGTGYTPEPTWNFGTPYVYRGPGDLSFLAGLCDSIGLAPIEETYTATLIGVAQLDPKYWDTSQYPPVPFQTNGSGGYVQPP
jgi:hypothetical protein